MVPAAVETGRGDGMRGRQWNWIPSRQSKLSVSVSQSRRRHPCGDTTTRRQDEPGLFITGHKASGPLLPPETVAASRILFVSSPGQAGSGEGRVGVMPFPVISNAIDVRPSVRVGRCLPHPRPRCLFDQRGEGSEGDDDEKSCTWSNPGKLAHPMCQEGVSIS